MQDFSHQQYQWAKFARLALPGDCDFVVSLIVGFRFRLLFWWDFGALECPRNSAGGVFGDVLGHDSDRPKLPALTSWLWIPKLPKFKKWKNKNIWTSAYWRRDFDAKKNAGFLLKKKRQFAGEA